MKHAKLLPLLALPLLLAPIRYQSGQETITLNPSAAPSPSATQLPAAGALASPTVIRVSPTFTLPTPTAVTTPTAPARAPAPSNLMPEVTALVCTEALHTMAELATLNYQQKRNQPAMTLTIAATAAATQASSRIYPTTLSTLDENVAKLSFGSSGRKEISTLNDTVQKACRNPVTRNAPGSQKYVPRPE